MKVNNWHPKWFSSIPRTVTDLHIEILSDIGYGVDKDIFEKLPTLLKKLNFKSIGPSQSMSSDCFATLQELVVLDASALAKFHSDVLKRLSRRLTHLSLSVRPLDLDAIASLPPNLRSFRPQLEIDFSLPGIENYWPTSLIHQVPESYAELKAALLKRIINEDCS